MPEDNVNNVLIEDSIKKHIDRVERQLKKITPAIFSDFLIERGGSQQCLSCGSPDLVVPESTDFLEKDGSLIRYDHPLEEEREGENASRFIDYVSYSKIDADRYISYSNAQYTVHCTNCGFMTQYKAAIPLQWYLNKIKKEKEPQ